MSDREICRWVTMIPKRDGAGFPWRVDIEVRGILNDGLHEREYPILLRVAIHASRQGKPHSYIYKQACRQQDFVHTGGSAPCFQYF